MRHGLFFPAFEGLADPWVVVDVARRAEAAGWDGIFLWDHLLYEDIAEISDPWIVLAAVATATERIQLGAMVTPLTRRRPAVLARQAVALDQLSGGRLILGFGLGDDGRVRELSSFGEVVEPRVRAERLDEGLAVVTGLLSGAEVSHRGTHFAADRVRFQPVAARPGGIPIWLAARWPHRAPMRRAAHYDGLFTIQLPGPQEVAEVRRRIVDERGTLDGFDIVCQGGPDVDPAPRAAAGATWWLTQYGPYGIEPDRLLELASAGPRVDGAA
ncbi:MAG TPA: LLM class flavin-dependent oxidoreductase [Mycobacteriales bacterium]|nr:LLM class flavin-dependent oxidoreductase [Mycobacteriales bacterium]